MAQTSIRNEEIGERGQELYARLRPLVETEENIGKIMVLDVQTEDYEIAEEGLIAGRRLLQRHPDAAMFCLRIGYEAVYSLIGELLK